MKYEAYQQRIRVKTKTKIRQALRWMVSDWEIDDADAVIAVHKHAHEGTNAGRKRTVLADRHSVQYSCLGPSRAGVGSKQPLTCQSHAFHDEYKLDDSRPLNHHPLHDIRNQPTMASDPDRGLSGWGIFFLVAFVFIVIGGCAWIM